MSVIVLEDISGVSYSCMFKTFICLMHLFIFTQKKISFLRKKLFLGLKIIIDKITIREDKEIIYHSTNLNAIKYRNQTDPKSWIVIFEIPNQGCPQRPRLFLSLYMRFTKCKNLFCRLWHLAKFIYNKYYNEI